MENSQNSQFLRTDKAITQALINLLAEKPFEKITVQDILEETPVTRATFYAHFRDKHEIAERMLKTFFENRSRVKEGLTTSPSLHIDTIQRQLHLKRDFLDALLKIHTETVDFRQAIAAELEKEYLASAKSPYKEIEARIFAQARTELYFAILRGETSHLTIGDFKQILFAVSQGLLAFPDHLDWQEVLWHNKR